jgi:hypothetical protein
MGRKGDFFAKKVPLQSKHDLLDSNILVLIKNMNVEKVSFQVKSCEKSAFWPEKPTLKLKCTFLVSILSDSASGSCLLEEP